MSSKTYSVDLTLEELRIIDGKINDKAQEVITKAIDADSHGLELPCMNESIQKSLKTGTFNWSYVNIDGCGICGKSHQYAKYKRSGRYHRKGETDYSKPIRYSGVLLNPGFFRVEGMGNYCRECDEQRGITKGIVEYILTNDLPIQIKQSTYGKTRYIKDDLRICPSCKKEMYESEMGREMTIMGNGTYPAYCPHCKKHAHSGGLTNQFKMRPVNHKEAAHE